MASNTAAEFLNAVEVSSPPGTGLSERKEKNSD